MVAAAIGDVAGIDAQFVNWHSTTEIVHDDDYGGDFSDESGSDSGRVSRRLTIGIARVALRKHLADELDLLADDEFSTSAQLIRKWTRQLQASRKRALTQRQKLDNKEESRRQRLLEDKASKRGAQENPDAFVPLNEALRKGWKGSPSTFFSLSYSSTTNRHIVNEQEKAILGTDTVAKWKAPPPKKQSPAQKRLQKYREARKKGFIGSPSSYKELSYSASANRHIYNKQSYREVEPNVELLPRRMRVEATRRMKFEALSPVEQKRREEAEARRAKAVADKKKRRQQQLSQPT